MPDKSEFEKHFHESRNMNDNLNVTILQNNIKTAAAQSIMETNRFVKNLALHGLKLKLVVVLKKCTISANSVIMFTS